MLTPNNLSMWQNQQIEAPKEHSWLSDNILYSGYICLQYGYVIELKLTVYSRTNTSYYYPYRAFGGQNKIVYSQAL